MGSSRAKALHLWENMEQQNHRQEAAFNLNESQQPVSANGEGGCKTCCFYQRHVSGFERLLPANPHLYSPSTPAAPCDVEKRGSSPPTLFRHSLSYVIHSDLIKLIYWARGSAHPQLIPTLFKIREVLGEGHDINRCTCANGVPADLWQRL